MYSVNDADRARLTALRDMTRGILAEEFANARSVALLDYPRHRNAGDALIYSGERAYLRELKVRRPYTVDIGRYDEASLRRALDEDTVVAFHGGGNLGDVWPEYQRFREETVPRLRGRQIVILPQSIWFTDPRAAARANRIFADHGRVTVLARDEDSMERARDSLPDVRVRFCPDMAFGVGEVVPASSPSVDLLYLSRNDHEKAAQGPTSDEWADVVTDWESGMPRLISARWFANKVPGIIHKRVRPLRRGLDGALEKSHERMADLSFESARHLLSQGRVVVTDRLHAHIFALLMGRPHVVLDNNYGKIRPIFAGYSGQFSTAHTARTVDEAVELARELL